MAFLLTVVWLALLTAPAGAQTGLYEPFPSGHAETAAKRYLKRLGPTGDRAADSLSQGQIEAGAFLAGTRAARDRAASVRAGHASHEGPPWPVQVLLFFAPFGVVLIAARN